MFYFGGRPGGMHCGDIGQQETEGQADKHNPVRLHAQ